MQALPGASKHCQPLRCRPHLEDRSRTERHFRQSPTACVDLLQLISGDGITFRAQSTFVLLHDAAGPTF